MSTSCSKLPLSSSVNTSSGEPVNRHKMSNVDDEDPDLTEDDITVYNNALDEELSNAILCVVYAGSMLGAAVYDTDTSQMQLMVDHSETPPDYPLLRLLIKQIEPTIIITNSRTDEKMLNILRESETRNSRNIGTSSESETNGEEERYVHILPNMDFALESAKHRLQNLDLPNMPKNMSDSEKRIYVSTVIDFTNVCMVKASGGLLKFLEKKRIGVQLEHESIHTPILSLSLFSLDNIVTIDDSTFKALQIFQQEKHPSVYKSGKGMKEGLSLYGIFKKCKSSIGSKEMRRLLLMPTNDIKIIEERQAAITFFIAARNVEFTSSLHGCLKHIRNVPRIIHRMKAAEVTNNDWQALYKTAYNAMVIGDICRSLPQQIDVFREISAAFTPDLFRIANSIHTVVDIDESTIQRRFVVKPGIDERLDHMKRIYNGLPDFMTEVAQRELALLSEDIQECSVIYLPQLGYLLAIQQTVRMKSERNFNIDGLDFMFATNNAVHYKSQSTRELDRMLGDTQCEITDYETQILHRLQDSILEMSQVLVDVVKYSAKLDCLIALSLVAKEFNYTCPHVSTNGNIEIIKGRHPLQELCVTSFVPNDIYSGGAEGKMKIITGPNASGKSVYLKQVALIVYMAHIGSFVPAEKAQIPTFDGIFTRIQTLESVSINQSNFLINLNQISMALNYATEKSLVIIDEFGKGTEFMGGLALLTSSLLHWIDRGPNCPHLYLSTHFHTLSQQLPPSAMIKYKTMETLKNGKELVFLYQLIDGCADFSFAHNAALRVGLPKETVERAMKISELTKSQQCITPCHREEIDEKLKKYKAIEKRFFSLDLDDCDVLDFLRDISGAISAPTPGTTSDKDTTCSDQSS